MVFPKTTWADGDTWNGAAVNDLEQRVSTAISGGGPLPQIAGVTDATWLAAEGVAAVDGNRAWDTTLTGGGGGGGEVLRVGGVWQPVGGGGGGGSVTKAAIIATGLAAGDIGGVSSVGATDKQIAKYLTSSGKAIFVNPLFIDPVADCGADPTGATDARPAFSTAVSAAVSLGWPIEVGYGTFSFSSQLTSSAPGIVIRGRHRALTTIVAAAGIAAGEVIKLTGANAHISDLTIVAQTSSNYCALRLSGANAAAERVTVTGTGSGSTGAVGGIFCDSTATNVRLSKCYVAGILNTSTGQPNGAGIYVGADDALIEDCQVTNCGSTFYAQQAGLMAAGTSGSAGQRIRIVGGIYANNGTHGIYAVGCDHLTIDGAKIHDNGAVATAAGGVGGADFGNGISLSGSSSVMLSPKVVNCTLFNNQADGLIVGSGAALYSDSSLISDAIVSNNVAYNNNQGQFVGGHGLEVNSVGGSITGNQCWGNGAAGGQGNGISVSGIQQTITGNHCHHNRSNTNVGGHGIDLNYQQALVTVASVTTTSGSQTATVASGGFPSVRVRQNVTGTNVAAGSNVQTVNGNTLTLSLPASGSGTQTLTFTSIELGSTVTGNICHDNDNNGIGCHGNALFYHVTISNNQCLNNGIAANSGANYDIYVNSNTRYGVYRNNSTGVISINDAYPNRGGNLNASDNGLLKPLGYGTTVGWNGEASEYGTLGVTDTNPFTINVPTIAFFGRRVTYNILNSSGGTMGTITWAAGFRLAGAFTNPASGKRRTITFVYDGTSGVLQWMEVSRGVADL